MVHLVSPLIRILLDTVFQSRYIWVERVIGHDVLISLKVHNSKTFLPVQYFGGLLLPPKITFTNVAK